MRHATCGVAFRARALATIALMAVGMLAALRGLIDVIM
jgi:hypothetical protein